MTVWIVELYAEGKWRAVGHSSDQDMAERMATTYATFGRVRVRESDSSDLPYLPDEFSP